MCPNQRNRCSPLSTSPWLIVCPNTSPSPHSIPQPSSVFRLTWMLLCLTVLSQLWLSGSCLAVPSTTNSSSSPSPSLSSTSPQPPSDTIQQRLTRSSPVPQVATPDHNPPRVTNFVSNPRKRTFSLIFPVPTVVSSLSNSSGREFSESPQSDDESVGDGSSLSETTHNPSESDDIFHNATITNDHHVPNDSMQSDQPPNYSGGDQTRTTILEIIDQSPVILDLPIHVNHELDPIVKSILENGTSSENSDLETLAKNNNLFRAGRETHDAFIKRILSAVSGDAAHNLNRYVHIIKPKGQRPLNDQSEEQEDLGLPADIADEYIDGVNPPKFPGIKAIHPLMGKDDWRYNQNSHNRYKPMFPGVDHNQPNLYNKPVMNQTKLPKPQLFPITTVTISPHHHHPPPKPRPPPPVPHPPASFQPAPEPVYVKPSSPVLTSSITINDGISVNNRNVPFRSKVPPPASPPLHSQQPNKPTPPSPHYSSPPPLTTPPAAPQIPQPNRANINHDLSLLLKQEFDEKNAELNKTKSESLPISPAGTVMHTQPPPQGHAKVFASVSGSTSSMSKEDFDKLVANITSHNPFSGFSSSVPPYQLPQAPKVLANSSSVLLFDASNVNENMKENVHYRPVPMVTTTTSTSTAPPPVSSTSSSSTHRPRISFTKRPSHKQKDKAKNQSTQSDKKPSEQFVRVRTPLRRPKPKFRITTTPIPITTTSTTTIAPPLTEHPIDPTLLPSTVKLPPSTPVNSSPEFESTISNDVRYQVDGHQQATAKPNLTLTTTPVSLFTNEFELNYDESRLFNTSLDTAGRPKPNVTVIDDVLIVPTPKQSTTYRLTTERLAYILIGSCCALSVLCLVIVAMSVRCKDMCDEYRSFKSAEKAAIRWQRHNRLRLGTSQLPYPFSGNILNRNRFNLPRYFRTSIDNSRSGQSQKRLSQPYVTTGSDKVLENILNGTKAPDKGNPAASNGNPNNPCCHCINCSSTWFFRNLKHGDWCCQQGYLQPPRRTKLPFGAASSVNTFMPRYSIDHNGDMKASRQHNLDHHMSGAEDSDNHHHHHQQRSNHNQQHDVEMCLNELDNVNDNAHWNRLGKVDPRLKETQIKSSNSGAGVPVKVNNKSNSRYFECAGISNSSKCNLTSTRLNSGPLFCEIEDEEDDDDEDDDLGDELATDFTNVFETHFREPAGGGAVGSGAAGPSSRTPKKLNNNQQHNNKMHISSEARCNQPGHSSFANLYHQQHNNNNKCNMPTPSKPVMNHSHNQHKSDQTGRAGGVAKASSKQARRTQMGEYHHPGQCKYYFDSATIHRDKHNNNVEIQNKTTKGESSSIWINSSKIVDKLHRKHHHLLRGPPPGHGQPPSGAGLPQPQPPLLPGLHPSVFKVSHIGGHPSRGGSQYLPPPRPPPDFGQPRHREHHRNFAYPPHTPHPLPRHCHSHFDPSTAFLRLGMPGKLTAMDNEHNFVVWNNDTNERLI